MCLFQYPKLSLHSNSNFVEEGRHSPVLRAFRSLVS